MARSSAHFQNRMGAENSGRNSRNRAAAVPEQQQFNSSVEQMQIALRELSFSYPEIPTIIPDGIFGSETAQATAAFQRRFGLAPTGKIDLTTWNAILQTYRDEIKERSEPAAIRPFPGPDYLLSFGDKEDLVYILQIMLKTIGMVFSNIVGQKITGEYDVFTRNAVREIQKASALEPTGNVDKRTWDKIAGMYEIYRPREEK